MSSDSKPGKNKFQYALVAGLCAGTLDGLAACISYSLSGGKDPLRVFHFIASGVFGRSALEGGMDMAIYGVIFHYVIATIWAFIFFTVGARISGLLPRNWLLTGLLYGVVVWIGMNLIVVPLSNTPPIPFRLIGVIRGMAILMVCIGLPISFISHRYNSAK